MPRYNPRTGARLVHRQPRYPVPDELLGDLDVQASIVIKLRGEVKDLQGRVSQLDNQAWRAGAAANRAAARGLRKMLYDRAGKLRGDASVARLKLSRTERTLREREHALAGLHSQARAHQRGEVDEAPEVTGSLHDMMLELLQA